MRKLVLLLVLALPSTAWAHQDRIFTVLSSGRVAGISKKFGKVMVVVKRNRGVPSVRVTVGNRHHSLPRCLAKWFSNQKQLRVTGSWWHRRSVLPPYINIRPKPRAKHTIDLLFSLTTGKLIYAKEHLVSGRTSRQVPLRGCAASALKALR